MYKEILKEAYQTYDQRSEHSGGFLRAAHGHQHTNQTAVDGLVSLLSVCFEAPTTLIQKHFLRSARTPTLIPSSFATFATIPRRKGCHAGFRNSNCEGSSSQVFRMDVSNDGLGASAKGALMTLANENIGVSFA